MARRQIAALLTTGALLTALATATSAQAQPTGAQAQPTGAASADATMLAARAADALVANRPAVLHASSADTFVRHQAISSGGLLYVPYDRGYQGLPVVGGDFVVVTDVTGRLVSTSVAQEQTISLASTTPTLSSQRAEAVARGQLDRVDRVSDTRLAVFALGTPKLAWETTVAGRDAAGPSRLTVVVDATTGAVLHTQEHVLRGTGTAAWNGPNPVSIATTHSGSTFLMRDPAHPTVQCQDAGTNTTFSGSDDVWGNGNATNRETGCVDALFAAETEERMLSTWLSRNGFDGTGGGWPIRVGLNDLNAFYDGTQIQIGHNTANQWISSIDVVAHEHGHGIDAHTPGGLSGAGTQEFVADVFGTSTEWFANEPAQFDGPDFLIGEKINLTGGGPIRNMYNPAALGHPNCYSSAIPSTEVHAAAGPGNHWFYLLAMGSNPTNGQPTSPTCNGARVTGIGVQTALRIMYNAMLMKTTGSSYLRYRTWTLTAAKNLTPGSCTNFNAVKAAWNAVSVPAQTGDPTCGPAPMAIGTLTCESGASRFICDVFGVSGGVPPYRYSWVAVSNAAILSGQGSSSISGGCTPNMGSTLQVTVTDSVGSSVSGMRSFRCSSGPWP